MKKLSIILAGILGAPLLVWAINVSVPTAPSNGYGLVSTTTSQWLATSTIFITNGSRVGIGTTNPTGVNANATLTVAGISSQDIVASTTDNTTLSDAILQAYAPGARVFLGAHGTNQVSTRYGLTLGGWGELGAFNSSSGTINGLIIGTNPAVPIVFGTNNLERMRLTPTGQLVIGSTSSTFGFENYGSASTTSLFGASLATCNAASSALIYNGTTGLFGCNTISSGGGGNSKWATSSSPTNLIYPNAATKVAIGTSTGFATFTVQGTDIASTRLASFINSASTTLFDVWNNGQVAVGSSTPWGTFGVVGTTTIPQFVVTNSASTVPAFIIDSSNRNGHIGAGTTSPLTQYDYVMQNGASANDSTFRVYQPGGAATNQSPELRVEAQGTNPIPFVNIKAGTRNWQLKQLGNDANELVVTTLLDGGGSTNAIDISTGGKVTIGPSATLQTTNALNAFGNMGVGTTFSTGSAPANSLIVQSLTGLGTSTPYATLSVMSPTGSTVDIMAVATSTGKNVQGVDVDGHPFTSGPAPTISSCGTGTGTVNGDDQGGTITTATAATSCTMTFAKAWAGNGLYCMVTDDSLVGFADISSTSTTAVTFGISSALTGGHLYYSCNNHK